MLKKTTIGILSALLIAGVGVSFAHEGTHSQASLNCAGTLSGPTELAAGCWATSYGEGGAAHTHTLNPPDHNAERTITTCRADGLVPRATVIVVYVGGPDVDGSTGETDYAMTVYTSISGSIYCT